MCAGAVTEEGDRLQVAERPRDTRVPVRFSEEHENATRDGAEECPAESAVRLANSTAPVTFRSNAGRVLPPPTPIRLGGLLTVMRRSIQAR